MSKTLSFDELDQAMTKVDPLGSVMTKNQFSRIDEYISTGNYLLNAHISGSIFKGIPNSRSVMLSGESGTGKTFVALNICREAQKAGYHVIYGDSEAAVDEDLMVKFGIDPEKVRYQPFKTALHVRHFVSNLCKNLKEKKAAGYDVPKILFVLDSMGNLATEKEIGDALSGSEKRDMTKQQNLRSMFRVITMDLAELKIPFIVTNHTYAAVGSYFPTQVVSGGGGAIYNASGILTFSKAQLKEGDQEAQEQGLTKTGIVVTSKIYKSRFTRPIPIKFHISFYKGMNPYVGLENYIDWETCGIGKGKLVEEIIETPVWEDEEKTIPKMFRGKQKVLREKTGKFIYEYDERGNKFAVEHLGKTIKGSELFSPQVFTQEVLEKLDEKIRPIFELPKATMGDDELGEALGMIDDEEENED
jgi:RecA/RadA recombinase